MKYTKIASNRPPLAFIFLLPTGSQKRIITSFSWLTLMDTKKGLSLSSKDKNETQHNESVGGLVSKTRWH